MTTRRSFQRKIVEDGRPYGGVVFRDSRHLDLKRLPVREPCFEKPARRQETRLRRLDEGDESEPLRLRNPEELGNIAPGVTKGGVEDVE